ncbi:MAG: helix-turn-helix transcriptional regulator [Mesorhizobium sp.]
MMSSPERRKELGEFLRSCREKRRPTEAEAQATRRRTPGLRREEVAARAGVGISWYTWLEQGRDINPTFTTLERIIAALEMSEDERRHLLNLAGQYSEPTSRPYLTGITAPMQNMLDVLNPTPAFFLNRKWDRIGWNEALLALMGDFRDEEGISLNTIWRMFMHPFPRIYTDNWEAAARVLIAEFFTGTRQSMEEPEVKELIDRLLADSPEFRLWWPDRHVTIQRGKRTGFTHPLVGYMAIERLYFEAVPNRDATLCIFSPADDGASRQKLDELLAMFRKNEARWNDIYMEAARAGQAKLASQR